MTILEQFWGPSWVLKMGTIMDLKKVEPTPKENLLPPLEIGPGRLRFLKMQVLGGVGVDSDIQIINKGVIRN